MLNSTKEAFDLLKSLGASDRLLTHLRLVGEAGDQIISKLDDLGVKYDPRFVKVGIALHDAGKILHPEELEVGGNLHEAAGEELLLKHGVPATLARCCRSHAQFDVMNVTFEEQLVALADKLWKGKRKATLELQIIDEVASRTQTDRWDVFEALDSCFEDIAAAGDDRLGRSL